MDGWGGEVAEGGRVRFRFTPQLKANSAASNAQC